MRRTTQFRRLLEAPEILVLPGVHDALGARIAQQAGFAAITCGGYSATAGLIGEPDTAQLTATELAGHYQRLCEAVAIPVFGDGDTGFGNVTNVRRTVRAYERAGLAGMFIEDQTFPKRCGHMAGKSVIPIAEMLAKVKTALDARSDPDFVIMARTDALAVNGIEDALARAVLFREAGADLIFVEAPETIEQMRRICRTIAAPCLANNIDGGMTPVLTARELQEIGYAVTTNALMPTYVYAKAMQELYAHFRKEGTTKGFEQRMLAFDEFNSLVGLAELRRREEDALAFGRTLAGRRAPKAAE